MTYWQTESYFQKNDMVISFSCCNDQLIYIFIFQESIVSRITCLCRVQQWIISIVSITCYAYPTDERVRQAIRYAIDKEAIVETMLYGAGEPADSVIPPSTFGFSAKIQKYEHNIEKAKELMADAGYPDGFSCTLSVTTLRIISGNVVSQISLTSFNRNNSLRSFRHYFHNSWMRELMNSSCARMWSFTMVRLWRQTM